MKHATNKWKTHPNLTISVSLVENDYCIQHTHKHSHILQPISQDYLPKQYKQSIMAPNLKHRSIAFLPSAAELDLQQSLKSSAFSPLTMLSTSAQSITGQAADDATQYSQQQHLDSSNYWEWSGDHDDELQQLANEEQAQELVSPIHIIDNIVQQSLTERARSSHTMASNDQYWDWSPTEDVSYWNWPSAKDEQRQLIRQRDGSEANTAYWTW